MISHFVHKWADLDEVWDQVQDEVKGAECRCDIRPILGEVRHVSSQSRELRDRLLTAAAALQSADALLISAGAGMGVDSGLPDFRESSGFWRAYPAIAERGISFEEMANPSWFRTDPTLAWAFYGHRFNLYRQTPPHRGFHWLREVAARKPHGWFVFHVECGRSLSARRF